MYMLVKKFKVVKKIKFKGKAQTLKNIKCPNCKFSHSRIIANSGTWICFNCFYLIHAL